MNVVACDRAECHAQTADDAGLFAVRNVVVTHHVAADIGLVPTDSQRAIHRFHIAGGRVRRGVIILVAIFPETHPTACRITDDVIFDDPALAPMWADHPNLLSRRWCPRGSRLLHGESAHGDEVDAGLVRVKYRLAHVDFDAGRVRVDPFELCPNPRAVRAHQRRLENQAHRVQSARWRDVRHDRLPSLPPAGGRDRTRA